MQKWKTDVSLYGCARDEHNRKILDYDTYVNEFLSADPVKDWDSIKGCIELWNFFKDKVDTVNVKEVIDAGTKDGQFTEYLNNVEKIKCIGLEIDDQYVKHAQKNGRHVIKQNICNMVSMNSGIVDVVFSHHVFGLCPSYQDAYSECLRITKRGGYVVTLNQVPGNPNKHYSLMNSKNDVMDILSSCPKHDIIYFDYIKGDNLIVILKKR